MKYDPNPERQVQRIDTRKMNKPVRVKTLPNNAINGDTVIMTNQANERDDLYLFEAATKRWINLTNTQDRTDLENMIVELTERVRMLEGGV